MAMLGTLKLFESFVLKKKKVMNKIDSFWFMFVIIILWLLVLWVNSSLLFNMHLCAKSREESFFMRDTPKWQVLIKIQLYRWEIMNLPEERTGV